MRLLWVKHDVLLRNKAAEAALFFINQVLADSADFINRCALAGE